MTRATSVDAYGVLTDPATLKIHRLLPGPIERVWAYLTESDLRSEWLAAGVMPLESGASFELVWRNDELSKVPGHRPPGVAEEERMQSRIIEVDPHRRLTFSWAGSGDVTFDLEPAGEEVLLTVTHRRLPKRATLLSVGAGWHMHLDILVARVSGLEAGSFWDGWARLRQEYDRRMPA